MNKEIDFEAISTVLNETQVNCDNWVGCNGGGNKVLCEKCRLAWLVACAVRDLHAKEKIIAAMSMESLSGEKPKTARMMLDTVVEMLLLRDGTGLDDEEIGRKLGVPALEASLSVRRLEAQGKIQRGRKKGENDKEISH